MQDKRGKAMTLGILVAAVLLAHLPLSPLLVFPALGNVLYVCLILKSSVMALLPFTLMKVAPQAAGFDTKWLPSSRLQWPAMLALVFLMFVAGSFARLLARHLELGLYRPYYIPTLTSFSRLSIALNGFLCILFLPIVEEIFWRGYVLDQLRKLMHWALALPVHAAVFAIIHFSFSFTFLLPLSAFFYALLLGAWRIKFKGLLPLMVAHITINTVAIIPMLRDDYESLRFLEQIQSTGSLSANLMGDLTSNAKCQQIAALTRQPAAKALPALFNSLGDDDAAVRLCAEWAVTKYAREDVRPYLKKAIGSARPQVVDAALFLLSIRPDLTLLEEVRHVVWSARDPKLQISAVLTLHDIGDTEGLRKVAERHPHKKTREAAMRFLQEQGSKPESASGDGSDEGE